MPLYINPWYKSQGFIDLGTVGELVNSTPHDLYAFPSPFFKGQWVTGARYGDNASDYISSGTYYCSLNEVKQNVANNSGLQHEIHEAHLRLYETPEYKESQI